jgi:hypothetical protein
MKMFFRTKDESNKIQEDEFLKFTPSERVLSFFALIYYFKSFPTTKTEKNRNFIIVIKNDKYKLG